jgi:alpha-tubulin suppressor-like RCC1 family protein
MILLCGCVSQPARRDIPFTPVLKEYKTQNNSGSPVFVAISSIGGNGYALRSDGKILCWGLNEDGNCEIPQNIPRIKSISNMNAAVTENGTIVAWGQVPEDVPRESGIIAVTRARFCDVALRQNGTLLAWNCRNDLQREMIEKQTGIISISENLGLKKDGTVVTWNIGVESRNRDLEKLTDIVAISNHWGDYAVLRRNGTVVAWSVPDLGKRDEAGVIPNRVAEGLMDIKEISAGSGHGLALKSDGTVVSWVSDSLTTKNLTDVVAVAAGRGLDLALKKDGTLVSWGDNDFGQQFIPGNPGRNIRSVSTAYRHSIALHNDGSITTWGIAFRTLCCTYGHEPPGIRNVTGILANGQQNLILENNQTIYGWGDWEYGPEAVRRIPHPYLALFGGEKSLFALKNDGTLVVLSYNLTSNNITPYLENVTDISSVNGRHTVAVKNDGSVMTWGESWPGQSDIPENLSGVIAVSTHLNFDLALKSDGTVVGWGENTLGQTDIPRELTGVTSIAAGEYHSLALKKDGTVVAWGTNMNGECNVPAGLSEVVAISAGAGQSLALKKDRTLVAWGETVIPDWNG